MFFFSQRGNKTFELELFHMRSDRSLIVFLKDDNQVRMMVVTTKQLVLDEIDDIEILKEKYQRTSFFFKKPCKLYWGRIFLFCLFVLFFVIHLTDTTVFLWGMYKEETVNSVHNIFEQNKKQKHGGKKIEELFLN